MDRDKSKELHLRVLKVSDKLLNHLIEINCPERLGLLALCMTAARLGAVLEDVEEDDVITILQAYYTSCNIKEEQISVVNKKLLN